MKKNIWEDKLWLKVKEGNEGDERKRATKGKKGWENNANEKLSKKSRFQLLRKHVRINLKSNIDETFSSFCKSG